MFSLPVRVAVSGHLPTGWGKFKLPGSLAANAAYKFTPGDDTPIPAEALKMSHSLRLFFADNETENAGTLLTDVPLEQYECLEYAAADIIAVFRMTKLMAAPPSSESVVRM